MDIELSTDNLRRLCRICFNDGVFNLWEHKVLLRSNGTENEQSAEPPEKPPEEEKELTIREMLKMYHNCEHTILELDDELKLICQTCLNNLISSYHTYRKLLTANKQLTQLYREAEHLNSELVLSEPEPVQNEHTSAEMQQIVDTPTEVPPSPTPGSPKQAKKRKIGKNPKFILTGGVTQLLANAQMSIGHKSSNAQKRARKQEPKMPANENAALLITQFIARPVIPNVYTPPPVPLPDDEGLLPTPPSELNTMDYGTVEIESAAIRDLSKEHNVEEALALSMAAELNTDANGEAIYLCKYCPQAFATPQFLISHARKSHVCKYCTEGFEKTPDLYAHIKQQHRIHKCAVCSKELSSHSNLRAHIRRMHGLNVPPQMAILKYRPLADAKSEEEDECGEYEQLDDEDTPEEFILEEYVDQT